MMKSIAVFVLLPLVLLTIFSISGCAGIRIKYLPPEEFVAQAKQIGAMTSIKWTTYIGVSLTRAYLEHFDALGFSSKSRTTVYWTELEKLPYDLRNKLKEGTPPCTPLQEEQKEKSRKFNLLQNNPWGSPIQQ